MSRRAWIIVGILISAPCLFFTFILAALILKSSLIIAFGAECWVENRTQGPIWVMPVASGYEKPVRLPHHPTRFTFARPPSGEVLIPPGERRRLVIDHYVAADIGGGLEMLVKTIEGEHFFDRTSSYASESEPNVIEDLTSLDRVSEEMIAALDWPSQPEPPRISLWLIIALGIIAPIAMRRFRRAYRELKPAT